MPLPTTREEAEERAQSLLAEPEAKRMHVDIYALVVGQRISCDQGIGTITALDRPNRKATIKLDKNEQAVEVPYTELLSIKEHKDLVRHFKDPMFQIFKVPQNMVGDAQFVNEHLEAFKQGIPKMELLASTIQDIDKIKENVAKLRTRIFGGRDISGEMGYAEEPIPPEESVRTEPE